MIPLGRRGSQRSLRFARAGGDPGVLCPRRQRNSHRMGQTDAGKYGAVDTALFCSPRGARIHRQRYLPAAAAYRERAANKGAIGKQMVDWQHALDQKWATLHFGEAEGGDHAARNTSSRFRSPSMVSILKQCGLSFMRTESRRRSSKGGNEVRSDRCLTRSRGCLFHATVPDYTSCERLHTATDTAALRSSGSARIRSNPMATHDENVRAQFARWCLGDPELALTFKRVLLYPLGTQETGGGVNFSIFSRYASRVRLELFDHPEDAVPCRIIDLDSAREPHWRRVARLGRGNRPRSTLCVPHGRALRTQRRASVQL